MNWQQVITTFILIAGVFLGVLEGIHLADILKQKLPSHTRLALEQFALVAVRQVEQQNRQLNGAAKKQLAIAAVSALFNAFGIPAPPAIAVDIAIEAAVLLLHPTNVLTTKNE